MPCIKSRKKTKNKSAEYVKKPPSPKQTKTITSTSVSRKIPTYGAPEAKVHQCSHSLAANFFPMCDGVICIQASGRAASRPKFTKMGEAHLG